VQVTRYRTESRQENYTVNKCEMVPEQRQVTYAVCVPRYEQVNQHVIDIANKGVHSYDQGTQGMQTNEHQMMGWFPA